MAQGSKYVSVSGSTPCQIVKIKYLIFSFFRSSYESKHGVEFHHSTRNPPEFDEKLGTEMYQ